VARKAWWLARKARSGGEKTQACAVGAALRLGPNLVRVRVSNVQVLFGQGEDKSMRFGVDMGLVF